LPSHLSACDEEGDGKGNKMATATKRVMETAARAMATATKRARVMVARGMGTATKRAMARAAMTATATRVAGD
jgi:hypothetical protein